MARVTKTQLWCCNDGLRLLQGKWSAPHFTSKAQVMDYVKAAYPAMISIFPTPCAFYTNFVERARPRCAKRTSGYLAGVAFAHIAVYWSAQAEQTQDSPVASAWHAYLAVHGLRQVAATRSLDMTAEVHPHP